MDTEHIKEFLVMAKTQNYTSASEELYISQSSIFKHIRALESELGVQLFERDGKKVVMSEYGKMFVHHAEVILGQFETFQTEVDNYNEAQANILTVIDEYPNPDLQIAFRRAYPKYSTKQYFMHSMEDLLNNTADLMILKGNFPELEKDFESIEIATDSIVAICPLDHPLAKRESVKMIELKNEGFIGFSINSAPHGDIDRLQSMYDVASMCRGAGFEPNIVMAAFPGSEVARLVAQGGGISLLIKNAIRRRIGLQVAYVDLDPVISFPIKIYYRKDSKLSQAAKDYINYTISWYDSYR